MRIVIADNYDDMSYKAFVLVKDVVKSNPRARLGLATGSTPIGLYRNMVIDHKKYGTSYKEVSTVNLDEYAGLDAKHEQSYAYFMRANLFDGIDIELKNTNIENGKARNADAECMRYNTILNSRPTDVQILGIGSNGHIAFNEPGTPFGSQTHVVELTESTIRDNSRLFKSIDEVPRKAFTMGLKNIMLSKKIIILASGENKAKAVEAMVRGPVTEAVPASILQLHPDCTLICDKLAASRI